MAVMPSVDMTLPPTLIENMTYLHKFYACSINSSSWRGRGHTHTNDASPIRSADYSSTSTVLKAYPTGLRLASIILFIFIFILSNDFLMMVRPKRIKPRSQDELWLEFIRQDHERDGLFIVRETLEKGRPGTGPTSIL